MATPTTTSGLQLSAEQIGYLAAGPGRAAETALARLLDAGLVRVSRDGHVSAVHQNNHGAATRLEARVLTHVRMPVRFDEVVKTAAWSTEMQSLHQQLREQGLTQNPRRRLPTWWVFLVVGGVLTVLGIGTPEFLIGAAAFLLFAVWVRGRDPVTRAGKAAVRPVAATDRVLAVALYGFRGKVAGQNVGDLFDLSQSVVKMVQLKRRKSSSDGGGSGSAAACGSCGSGCGSSSSSSGGSSCGGGGCGGGGGGD
ncbi:TIGR04222 domain-containing membrane protein [Lentzea sp. PSKA42]|uniref:TIGR04222 domain-containing membrane protein n=1 Tax=Lentzea indica TaxID=2604800 RepID=A0ABX1FCM2_9PSEU|nr:TIGR04222 domain-containing membrane protein [Lentzea indica]NKE56607.1 TIGR04222 domain-containing membrane protein [Lentzea indica]